MIRQQRLIDALKEQLSTIQKVNGYHTDIGKDVREWEIGADEKDIPFVDVRDDEEIIISASGAFEYSMPLNIVVMSKGKTAREEARKMAYDVLKCIGENPDMYADNECFADRITPNKLQLIVEQGSALVAGVIVSVTVQFSTDAWQAR